MEWMFLTRELLIILPALWVYPKPSRKKRMLPGLTNYWLKENSKPSNTGGGRRPYALALAINVVAVAIDGRFDSENLLDSEGQMTMLPWPTLLSPAGFAFAIWGLIYVGELAGLAVVLRTGGADDVGGAAIMQVVRASNTAWLAANCAQARF